MTLRRAQPAGGPRGVHRHVAAADDDDAPALELGRRAEPHVVQELDAAEDPRVSSPGTPRLVDRGVPVATRTASNPSRRSAPRSPTGQLVAISTPMSVTFLMSFSTTSVGSR